MDIPDSLQPPYPANHPLPEPGTDGFEAGSENRLRRLAARLAGFAFQPPRLPWPMVLFAMLCVLVNGIFTIAIQTPEFWATGKHNLSQNIFNALLDISPLAYLGFYLIQMLIAGLMLLVLHYRVALVVWIYIGFDFIFGIGWDTLHFFFASTEITNRVVIGLARLLTVGGGALLCGLAFSGGMNVLLTAEKQPSRSSNSLKAALILLTVWLLSISAVTVRNAAAPQPTWRKVITQNSPPARTSFTVAYDTARRQAVLFGGAIEWDETSNWIGLDDTWVWDGNNWTEQHPAKRPPARLDAAMAYDEKRGEMVMFGGQNQGVGFNDTWVWDGGQWTERTPELSPQPRCCVELAYDPTREQVVLFSGYAPDRTPPEMQTIFYFDAWGWDGQNWQEIHLATHRYSSNYAMIPDPYRPLSMFIFDYQGLWTWQGDQIRLIDTGQPPGGKWNVGLAYDPNRNEMVAYGGVQNGNKDTGVWRFDGARWQQIFTAETPPAREKQGMFYDQTRGRVIMFGGEDHLAFFNDTWELILP